MTTVLKVIIRPTNKQIKFVDYKNSINFHDPNQLSDLFMDLEIHGANIEKSFRYFKRKKDKDPVW